MVLRSGMIKKDVVPYIENMYRTNKLNHLALILNGVDITYKKYGYGATTFGYGYGYSSDEE